MPLRHRKPPPLVRTASTSSSDKPKANPTKPKQGGVRRERRRREGQDGRGEGGRGEGGRGEGGRGEGGRGEGGRGEGGGAAPEREDEAVQDVDPAGLLQGRRGVQLCTALST